MIESVKCRCRAEVAPKVSWKTSAGAVAALCRCGRMLKRENGETHG
jgi:hypothetical protein